VDEQRVREIVREELERAKKEEAAIRMTAFNNAPSVNGRIKLSNPIQSAFHNEARHMNTFCKTMGEQETLL
jgi:hypothetical protein